MALGEATPWNTMNRTKYQISADSTPSMAARPGLKFGFLDSSLTMNGASQPPNRKPPMTAAAARPEKPAAELCGEKYDHDGVTAP
jgi:hypothetical protein